MSASPLRDLAERALWMRGLAMIGDMVVRPLHGLLQLMTLGVAVALQAFRPASWRRTVRYEFRRHCHEIGIDALPSVIVIGGLVGLGLVLQALYWLGLFGQSDITGRLLVLVLVRELAPLIVGLILIGRSVSMSLMELTALRSQMMVRAMDAMGVDPFHMLVMPRVIAMSLCCFALTVFFISAALLIGYAGANASGYTSLSLTHFMSEVLDSMSVNEFILVVTKSLLIGYIAGLIACSMGLSPDEQRHGGRALLARGFVASMAAALIISGLISALL